LDGDVILCGDIGGTKTNLALFAPDAPTTPVGLVSYASRTAGDLVDLVARYLPTTSAPIDAACFAIAGPVVEGVVETTNLPWVVRAETLSRAIGGAPVFLLNDLEALAYGVSLMTTAELAELNAGRTRPRGNVAVIAAGSGLGEAGLVWTAAGHVPLASEGGHADFAPRSEREVALLRYLTGRFGHVSYERIVSGPGLVHLFDYLRDVEGIAVPPPLATTIATGDPAAAITAAALAGTPPIAVAALDLFTSIYGAEAGNLALKLKALGGVFVGGGIAPKILPKLTDGTFRAAFLDKGRFAELLIDIPVQVVLEQRAGLFGAAHYAAMQAAGR
jgi:glucokinase